MERFDLEDSPVPGATRSQLIPDKHLSLPIITTLLDRLDGLFSRVASIDTVRYMNDARYIVMHLRRIFADDFTINYSGLLNKIDLYADVYILNGRQIPEQLNPRTYPDLTSIEDTEIPDPIVDVGEAHRVAELEISAYIDWVGDLLPPHKLNAFKKDLLERSPITAETWRLWRVSQTWSKVVENSRRAYKTEKRIRRFTVGGIDFIVGHGYGALRFQGKWRTLVWEQLQMIQDMTRARFNVSLAIDLGFHNGTTDLRQLYERQLAWQEKCIRLYGNEGYDLVKSPESCWKALMTRLTNGDVIQPSSYDRTIGKIREKEKRMDPLTPCVNELAALGDDIKTVEDAAELFGLIKLSGHPSVYADRSGRSVQSVACSKSTATYPATVKMRRFFRHAFINSYLREHSAWPRFERPPKQGTKLHRHWINQATALPLGSYDFKDLDVIEFGQVMDFDYSVDYLQFMDDRAICPGADYTPEFWFGSKGSKQASQGERRLLSHLIHTEDIDPQKIAERMMRGEFTMNELIVELSQKEREFKMSARSFAKMTFEVRLFWIILEFNLKRLGELYFPQQTMTMSNAQEKQRLYDMVKNWKKKDSVFVEVDFSTWNNRWRKETSDPVGRDLGDLFGIPLAFIWIHRFFEKATIVVTDKNFLPPGANPDVHISQWPASDLLWRGTHVGGFEGTQQFYWTWCTMVMMYIVMYDRGVSYRTAGQGDNHIFALQFDCSRRPLQESLVELLQIMEVRCHYLNHEVKPEECIDSTTVLTYSKEIYVKGVQIQYVLKFAARAFDRDDKETPSLTREVAGLMSCAIACADMSSSIAKCLRWKHIILRLFFRERLGISDYGQEHKKIRYILSGKGLYAFTALLPGSLGGFPVQPWTRFFMKGEVDDLSWDVASVVHTGLHFPPLQSDLRLCIKGEHSVSNPDRRLIIQDPSSIPLTRPDDRTSILKMAVEDAIPRETRNRDLRQIFGLSAVKGVIQETLASADPLYPDIMADLYAFSPPGLRDGVLARFTMTRTLAGLVGTRIIDDVKKANVAMLDYVIDRYKRALRSPIRPTWTQPYQCTSRLRSLWQLPLQNANIGVYTPFDFNVGYPEPGQPWISCTIASDPVTVKQAVGDRPPNFGTRTRAKVAEHGYRIVSTGSAIRDLKGLVLTLSELGSSTELADFCDKMALFRSPWSARTLSAILPTAYGGAAAHRHMKLNQAHFAVLGSKTVPTHLSFSSDDSGKLSGGIDDYPFPFQAFFLTLTAITQDIGPLGLLSPRCSFGFLLTDNYEPITTKSVTVPPLNITTTPLTGNKLAYVDRLVTIINPDVPPANLIPRLLKPRKFPKSLVYSYLVSTYWGQIRRFPQNHSTVRLPIDLFDLKEFIYCPANAMLEGSAMFLVATSLYHAQSHTGAISWTTMWRTLRDNCYILGGFLARLFMHPACTSRPSSVKLQSQAGAGPNGALGVALKVSDSLWVLCRDALRDSQWSGPCTLVLFEGFSPIHERLLCAHSLLCLVMQKSPPGRIRITSAQGHMVKAACTLSSSPSHNARAAIWVIRQLKTARDGAFNAIGASDSHIVYTPASPQLAIRDLRALRPPTALREASALRFNTIDLGRTKWQVNGIEGCMIPTCTHPEDIRGIVSAELAISSMRRIGGFHSSVRCDWEAIFEKHPVSGDLVVAIGVGAGGSACAALNHSARAVYGVDLKTSFPNVVQREGGYKPPEVVSCGYQSKFTWHPHVWRSGGDARTMRPIPFNCHIILDIDSDEHTVWQCLNACRGPGSIIVRVQACTHWINYFIDALRPSTVYKISTNPYLIKSTWILVANREMLALNDGNHENIVVNSAPVSRYSLRLDKAQQTSYICNLISVSPLSLQKCGQKDLSDLADRLVIDEQMAGTYGHADKIRVINDLRDAVRLMEPTTIWVPSVLAGFSRRSIRIACRALGTGFPTQAMFKHLSSDL